MARVLLGGKRGGRRRSSHADHEVAGAPPGEVTSGPVEGAPAPLITVFSFNKDELEERVCDGLDDALRAVKPGRLTWINVDGLGNLDILKRLWDQFKVHPLIQEDIINTHQRPKFEEYDDQDFLVMRMVQLREGGLQSEQVSVVFGKDWLLSFQETRGDVFDPVRTRLRVGRPRLRGGGADYLAYSLLDALVDGFFPLIDTYEERLEILEDEVFRNPGPLIVEVTHVVRRDLLLLRRWLWPLREAIAAMQRTEGSLLVKKDTRLFLRDAYDHVVRVMEVVESYRELAGSITELHASLTTRRLNEVIKVLTVVTTIFIPVTFVASIYGMNFPNMPELGTPYGYFIALGIMGSIILGELVFFRKRGWI